MHRERVKARLGDDEIYHLIELKEETDFIQDIVILPFSIVTWFSEGKNCNILFLIQYVRTYYLWTTLETVSDFRLLIDREEL